MWRVIPFRCLFDYGSDCRILDHDPDVDTVMHSSENAALVRIRHVDIFEKLEPKCLQLVSIVLKKIEVISDGRQDFVEVFLEVTAVLFCLHLTLDLIAVHGRVGRGCPSLTCF